MNVSACIATRGDIDMQPILDSLPTEWEIIVWDNGRQEVWRKPEGEDHLLHRHFVAKGVFDLGPYGRFEGLRRYATNDLCFVQDDDVIVSDPQGIVDAWLYPDQQFDPEIVVCNMPQEFRPHYPDSAMLGFGGAFHRDAPERAFSRFLDFHRNMRRADTVFQRESCRIFTTLTPRVLVDIPKTDMPYASDPNRLWKDPKHVWYRGEALRLAREVRDA